MKGIKMDTQRKKYKIKKKKKQINYLPEALSEEAISDLFFLECETAKTTTPMLTHKIRTRAIRAGR